MPISEPIQYTIIFVITVIFTVFALTIKEHRMFLKMTAGLCWFIMALLQFILGEITSALTLPFVTLFMALGFIFFFSTILDWHGEKKDRFFRSIEE